ncbi:MAG TPA: hypothetical protein VFU22_14525 [Roseiflexaceae bacterium]|nr:hypothetical protein [Roseiflexaceae bacterium]
MTNALLDRILRESQGANLLDLLAEQLPPTDLQSLLLEVYRRRAAQQTPAALLGSYERSRFARPSPLNPMALLDVDRLAFSLAAPQFEPLELAPVCPLGTSSMVASVDQNKALATIRNTEVVSDSTNALALECAVRRRAHLRAPGQRHQRVRLCASHRLLRPQAFSGPASFAHFRLFGLCTAGRDEGSYRFELDALAEQLAFYLRLFAALQAHGYAILKVRVAITEPVSGAHEQALRADVMATLAAEFPQVQWQIDPDRSAGRNYYDGLCFAAYASDSSGQEYMLVDGGFTSWTQQLLSNQKERLLISGIGTERLCSVFHPPAR